MNVANSYSPVKLAYNILEPATNPAKDLEPIIFLHGITFSKDHWSDIPQIVANSTRRRVYVLDARNHGDSEWSEEFNFDILADDLLHFMDSHNIPKSILVGHSMGGVTAFKAALKNPGKVKGLIVEDMLVRKVRTDILDTVVLYFNLLRKFICDVPTDVDNDSAKKWIIDAMVNDNPELFQALSATPYLDLKQKENGRYAFKFNLEAILRSLSNEATLMKDPEGEYTGPTCFMYGVLSPYLVGEDQLHIKKFFPNAEFIPIEASHDVHREKPAEFAEAVINFVKKFQC